MALHTTVTMPTVRVTDLYTIRTIRVTTRVTRLIGDHCLYAIKAD